MSATPAPAAAATARPGAAPLGLHGAIAIGVLACACLQGRIGGQVSPYGEESGIALPIATLALLLGLLALAITGAWRHGLPRLSVWHLAFIAAACVGLAGMSAADLKPALKELIQLGEITVAAWLLTTALPIDALPRFLHAWGRLALLLLLLGAIPGLGPGLLGLSQSRWAGMVVLASPLIIASIVSPIRRPAGRVGVGIVSGILLALALRQSLLLLGVATAVCLLLAWRLPHLRRVGVVAAVVALAGGVLLGGIGAARHALSTRYDAEHAKRLVLEARAARHAPSQLPLGGGLGAYKRSITFLRSFDSAQPSPHENTVPRDANNQYLLLLVESGVLAPLCLLGMLLGLALPLLRRRPAAPAADPPADLAPILGLCLLAAAGAMACAVLLGRGSGIWVGALLGLATRVWRHDPVAHPAERPAAAYLSFAWRLLPAGAVASLGLVALLQQPASARSDDPRSALNRRLAAALLPADPGAAPTERTAYGLPVIRIDPDARRDDHRLRIEGESYASASGAFHTIQDNDASGHAALEIPADSGKASGEAVYTVDLPAGGIYTFQARVYWRDGCSNSLAFSLGDAELAVSSELFGAWHELPARQHLTLPPGPLHIRIRNLEDGVRLDYMTLQRLADSTAPATN